MSITLQTGRKIGPGHPVYVIAEIGINHNGDMELVEELIIHAKHAGADAVKFQMRTVDVVYSPEELAKPRQSPFGDTNGDLKRGLELSVDQYCDVDRLCGLHGLDWSASCWDVESHARLEQFNPPWHKVAGPCVTDEELLRAIAATERPVMLSCGMSCDAEWLHAYKQLGGHDSCVPMHCISSYPTSPQDSTLCMLHGIRQLSGTEIVGYSGHELGTALSIVAVALGASVIERHITASRSLWGSDQSWSLEPQEFAKMVDGIREVCQSLDGSRSTFSEGTWRRTRLLDCERPAWEKLRRFKGETSEVTHGT